jgi:hypothetical protein
MQVQIRFSVLISVSSDTVFLVGFSFLQAQLLQEKG